MTGVRYVSLAEHSGYGIAAQGYLRALLRAGVRVQWFPLLDTPAGYAPWDTVEGANDRIAGLADERLPDGAFGRAIQRTLRQELDYDTIILHCTPEHWPRYMDSDRQNIGYTVWETDTPPPHWLALINSMDRVLVPSRFNKVAFQAGGIVRPLDVIPHTKKPDSAPPSPAQIDSFFTQHGIPREHFIFYTIEAWTPRKAPWKTIHAFLQAFTGDQPVSLVVKTSRMGPRSGAAADNTPTEELVLELVSHYAHAPKVTLINHAVPTGDVDLLHHVGDCYLSLTHSEGWGLGAFEAAAAGNPVLITGWGGHLEYLTPEWPYLIEYEMAPVMDAQGRHSYLPTQAWASPHMDHAVRLIREIYSNPARARLHGERLAKRIDREYNERVIGQRLLEVLQGNV